MKNRFENFCIDEILNERFSGNQLFMSVNGEKIINVECFGQDDQFMKSLYLIGEQD